jgi:hypothetical protein
LGGPSLDFGAFVEHGILLELAQELLLAGVGHLGHAGHAQVALETILPGVLGAQLDLQARQRFGGVLRRHAVVRAEQMNGDRAPVQMPAHDPFELLGRQRQRGLRQHHVAALEQLPANPIAFRLEIGGREGQINHVPTIGFLGGIGDAGLELFEDPLHLADFMGQVIEAFVKPLFQRLAESLVEFADAPGHRVLFEELETEEAREEFGQVAGD